MYAPMQRGLHHLVAGLILVMLPLGLLLPHLDEGDLASVLYEVHKSLGMSVFALVLIRLALRIYMGAPPDPTAVHPLLYSLAKLGHGLLYILILGLPMLGYTATSGTARIFGKRRFGKADIQSPSMGRLAAWCHCIGSYYHGLLAFCAKRRGFSKDLARSKLFGGHGRRSIKITMADQHAASLCESSKPRFGCKRGDTGGCGFANSCSQ